MGVAKRHAPSDDCSGLSPSFQPVVRPCISLGRSSPSAGVQACCCVHGCSTMGWGATYNGHAVSGLWSGPHLHWHINYLKLLTIRLALGRFKMLLQGKHVLVRTDNTATVVYINHQGGLRSRHMLQLARHLLLWSQKHLRSLRAIYIPGLLNRAANELSRQHALPGEWRLHPRAIQLIWRHFGAAQVDLFASPDTSHCLRKYAFPPMSLLAQTLRKVREDKEQILLVTPYWPNRTWFPEPMLLATASPGAFLWRKIYFLRDWAPSGTCVQICGTSTCGP